MGARSDIAWIFRMKSSSASLRLPSYFTDHMVVQRGKPIRIFGTAAKGKTVTVGFRKSIKKAKVQADGTWEVALPAEKPGAPGEITISDGRTEIVLRDVLVGDVWVCSGQSNMQWIVEQAGNAEAEIAAGDYPQIRHFAVDNIPQLKPINDVPGTKWEVCTPETVGKFTAVGYYFAKTLLAGTKVPVGLLNTSWGGTPIESWIPADALKDHPRLEKFNAAWKKWQKEAKLVGSAEDVLKKWQEENLLKDPGNKGEEWGWAAPDFDDSQWETMHVPGNWERYGLNYDGSIWFRLAVDIPKAWAGKSLHISLGAVDDHDTTYWNGVKIGGIGLETPEPFNKPRNYDIPANLVKKGRNVIAVRVFDVCGSGGFTSGPEHLKLSCPSRPKDEPMSLVGLWRYGTEWIIDRNVTPMSAQVQPHHIPALLYNGMVHGLIKFPVAGTIWYQGESNAGRAAEYGTLFTLMIKAWRKAWKDAKMPFYFVQLANYQPTLTDPRDSLWAELRESQNKALKLPNTGTALAIDIGDAFDIHPANKQEVGRRLAALALNRLYGKKTPDQGPTYKKHSVEKGGIRITFDAVEKGLQPTGKKLLGFAVAGKDRKFKWADARIVSKSAVLVNSPEVPEPVAVRYAWADNPETNLHNSAGLPANPFRTDKWPGITVGKTWPL